MSIIDTFKRWSRLAPPPSGPLPQGLMVDALKLPADAAIVILAIDSNGRVFRMDDGEFVNGSIRQILNGRTAIMTIIDKFGVEDALEWAGY